MNKFNLIIRHHFATQQQLFHYQRHCLHKTATVEKGTILKAPIIICDNAFVGANSYIRGGVYLDKSVKIEPNCEIKSSIICSESSINHLISG